MLQLGMHGCIVPMHRSKLGLRRLSHSEAESDCKLLILSCRTGAISWYLLCSVPMKVCLVTWSLAHAALRAAFTKALFAPLLLFGGITAAIYRFAKPCPG